MMSKTRLCISKIIAASLFLALDPIFVSAQVKSVILSAEDREPVSFACIINKEKTLAIVADEDGRFTIPAAAVPKGEIIVTRIGYAEARFAPKAVPDTIFLQSKATELQGVEVHPLKRKTLGHLYKPNFMQKIFHENRKKLDPLHLRHSYTFNKELARRFKLKDDSQLLRLRICLSNPEDVPITLIFNIYRKVGDEWISILNDPIHKKITDKSDPYIVREIDLTEAVEPQPAGEYLIGITKLGEEQIEARFTAKVVPFPDTFHRSLMDDSWIKHDLNVGMELDIAY